jgi:hypothetical protein
MVQRAFLKSLVESIFKQDQRIRFVAVYEGQYTLAGEMRPGVPSYDPESVSKEIDLQLAKMGGIAKAWEQWFGRLDAIALRYSKINLVFKPLSDGKFLVVSTEPDYDPLSLLPELPKLVGEGAPP